jgi:hypothetical protein
MYSTIYEKSCYFSLKVMFMFLTFINFCETKLLTYYAKVDGYLNKCLEGYVLYYVLYSKEDKFCAVLYDYRSFMKRLYIVVCSMIYSTYLKNTKKLFHYKDVIENIDNLSSFFVDCAVVEYIKDGSKVNELIANDTVSTQTQTSPIKFVYAIVVFDDCELDFTKYFNIYCNGILNTKTLECRDIITLLSKVANQEISTTTFTLKCMMDNKFEEILFKDNDNISKNITL